MSYPNLAFHKTEIPAPSVFRSLSFFFQIESGFVASRSIIFAVLKIPLNTHVDCTRALISRLPIASRLFGHIFSKVQESSIKEAASKDDNEDQYLTILTDLAGSRKVLVDGCLLSGKSESAGRGLWDFVRLDPISVRANPIGRVAPRLLPPPQAYRARYVRGCLNALVP